MMDGRSFRTSFRQPEDISVRVWRYLDMPRLVGLLHTRQLPLTRLDLLPDPFEGSTPQLNIKGEQDGLSELGAPEEHKVRYRSNTRIHRLNLRRATYASYWHVNNDESDAMWKLYCGPMVGIALQTTYQKLRDSLQADESGIGMVEYIDYEKDRITRDGALAALMYKRKAFRHEREARIIHLLVQQLDGLDHGDLDVTSLQRVFPLPWNLKDVVEHLYVHPAAPEWYYDASKALIAKFEPELEPKLIWSRLNIDPLF